MDLHIAFKSYWSELPQILVLYYIIGLSNDYVVMSAISLCNTILLVSMLLPKKTIKIEAKDVLPNINRTKAAERAGKCHFCPW